MAGRKERSAGQLAILLVDDTVMIQSTAHTCDLQHDGRTRYQQPTGSTYNLTYIVQWRKLMPSEILRIDGDPVRLSPPPLIRNDMVWVPLEALCAEIGAYTEEISEKDRFLVCQDDRCVPVQRGEDTMMVDDVTYVPLPSVATPFGLNYEYTDAGIRMSTQETQHREATFTVGEEAPTFTLPDVRTGESISLEDYRGTKTLIFAWASW